jgi:hypothetical protein
MTATAESLAARSWPPPPAAEQINADPPQINAGPPAEPTWRPLSLRHARLKADGAVEISFQRGGAAVFLGLEAPQVKLAALLNKDAPAILETALQVARQHPSVARWQAAERELATHRKAADLARKRLNAIEADRAVLLAEGGGEGLAKQLRDLDEQRAARQRELADAEQLLRHANEFVLARAAEATASVANVHRIAAQTSIQRGRARETELLERIAEAVAPFLTELVATRAAADQTSGLLLTGGGGAGEVLSQLRREAMPAAM